MKLKVDSRKCFRGNVDRPHQTIHLFGKRRCESGIDNSSSYAVIGNPRIINILVCIDELHEPIPEPVSRILRVRILGSLWVLMMNLDTQLFRLLLVLIAASGLTACGSGQNDAPSSAKSTEADTQEEAAIMSDDASEAMDDAAAMAESMTEQADDAVDTAMDDAEQAVDNATETVGSVADDGGDPCSLTIGVGDGIMYSTNSMSVPASCETVTVTLTHTGTLPAAAMGHNWVLVPADAADAVASAGMSAGLDGNYLPADDDRIVAATKIIGGGESVSVTFSLAELADGTDYVYVCTFPGHWSVMKGTFTVEG